MTAIDVVEPPRFVIIFAKEERGVRAVGRVFVKELIHGFQEPLWLIQCNSTLAAQVRLKISHQERRSDPFSCDIADDQSKPFLTEIQEIIIITSNLALLD